MFVRRISCHVERRNSLLAVAGDISYRWNDERFLDCARNDKMANDPCSPNANAILRIDEKFLFGLYIKRAIPGVNVPHDTVNPILTGRVRIAYDLFADGIIAQLAAPRLRPAEKDTLFSR